MKNNNVKKFHKNIISPMKIELLINPNENMDIYGILETLEEQNFDILSMKENSINVEDALNKMKQIFQETPANPTNCFDILNSAKYGKYIRNIFTIDMDSGLVTIQNDEIENTENIQTHIQYAISKFVREFLVEFPNDEKFSSEIYLHTFIDALKYNYDKRIENIYIIDDGQIYIYELWT